jgi:hypothetical protein
METSRLIARLLGPVLATVGVGMLTNQADYREMAEQFLANSPFIYITGVLALVSGLAIPPIAPGPETGEARLPGSAGCCASWACTASSGRNSSISSAPGSSGSTADSSEVRAAFCSASAAFSHSRVIRRESGRVQPCAPH